MDKNTILAFALCAGVIIGYDALFVAPKRAEAIKKHQVVAIKEDIKSPIAASTEAAISGNAPSALSFKEENNDIKTTKTGSSMSNVGGALHNIKIGDKDVLPLTKVLTVAGYENEEFKVKSLDANRAVYYFKNDRMEIKKTVEYKDEHNIFVRMEINSSAEAKINLFDIDFMKHSADAKENSLYEYFVSVDNKVVRKGNAFKFEAKENKTVGGQVQFAGFRDHFNIIVIHPEGNTKTIEINKVTESQLSVAVSANKAQTYDFSIYVGPQDTMLMKKYGKGFEKAVAFSRFWILNTISFAIYYTIPFLHLISRSWGISIILISLIIYGLSYPLTIKSMMSMRKMQQAQPKIKALQDRFKGDPTKLNAEIMEIYKREKINPLGGCLPFLLQMPLFISLYQVLWRSFYFQGQSFLWIKDLSLPDRLIMLPFSLPFLGNELNILPILMGIVMFFQQKVTAKNAVVTDEQQVMQQKMMMYFFPFFIGFIFYKFASGLSLYFTVFYALSTWTQMKMNSKGIVVSVLGPKPSFLWYRGEKKPKEK